MTQGSGLTFERFFSSANKDPYDEINWVKRDAIISNSNGSAVFEQKDVEAPDFWSDSAVNIVASRYFRGSLNTAERERSVKNLIWRVVETIVVWGSEGGYYDYENARIFNEELRAILANQFAAFNTPTWLNLGWSGRPQSTSACYLNSVEDSMQSILQLHVTEGMLFKSGAGSGVNLSTLRSKKEALAAGGHSSGPVSFMRALDSNAGAIKSGGSARRAACMRILNVDHPDIAEFISAKTTGEKVAQALIDAGFDNQFNSDGGAYTWAPYQNANHSVRVTDEFMEAVEGGKKWDLKTVTDGSVIETVEAKDLFRSIAEAAWQSGDPGIQFDSKINEWHTTPNNGRINTSNPCIVGETLITTRYGNYRIDELCDSTFSIIGSDGAYHVVDPAFCTGKKPVYKLTTIGHELILTKDHLVSTTRGDVPVSELIELEDEVIIGEELLTSHNYKTGLAVRKWATTALVISIEYAGEQLVYDITEPSSNHFIANGIIVHNCSEVLYHDDVSCNLASINLMRFYDPQTGFNVDKFQHTCRILITAMEICVGFSDYPTDRIRDVSHACRPLGLGFCALGELLMAMGIPYDSGLGRDWAGAITALMAATAYSQSARIASILGSFEWFDNNRNEMLSIIDRHRELLDSSLWEDAWKLPNDLCAAVGMTWDEAYELGSKCGYRNGQVVVQAPTGTISFYMSAGTTGVEPAISLVNYKKLVGGGLIKTTLRVIRQALLGLGYDEHDIGEMISYIEDTGTIEGAPYIKLEHLPVFDCALRPENGTRFLPPLAHVKMCAAIQPFCSGGISKSVNMPNECTVEDIENIYMEAWRLGLKSISIYRDGSKRSQPLSTKKSDDIIVKQTTTIASQRRRLPDERASITHHFQLGSHDGYITVGLYPDNTPGEIFIVVSKEGSTISGLMDAFATSVSLALQYGIPLEVLVQKYSFTNFPPNGWTKHPEIPSASSIVDYVMRWMALKFLSNEKEVIKAIEANTGATITNTIAQKEWIEARATLDSPICSNCGSITIRSGTCLTCPACGQNSGCA